MAAALWSLAGDPAIAQQRAAPVRVDAVRVEPLLQTSPVIGRLVARQAGVVAARINGPVAEFLIEVGDRVAAGQIIAVLDDSALAARRDLAAAQLIAAEATAGTRRAELAIARQEMQRMEGLRQSAAFNQGRFDDLRQQVAKAEAALREGLGRRDSTQAELRLAEINLFNAEVRAPYSGVVTARLTEAGAYVGSGEPVVRMIGDENLEIEADVPFQRLGGLVAGAEVDLTLADGSRHRAVVRAVVPNENPRTQTRAVRFVPRFGATVQPLAPGQSATILIPQGAPREVVTVSKDALIPGPQGTRVFVVEDGKAAPRMVDLGDAVGDRFEVLQGLQEGDLAVVRGNERLRPGAPVQVAGETG